MHVYFNMTTKKLCKSIIIRVEKKNYGVSKEAPFVTIVRELK